MNIRKIDIPSLLRFFSIMNNGEIDVFLGSGASAQAGIPTGHLMTWDFKREIYCTEQNINKEYFKDLNSVSAKQTLKSYFDSKSEYVGLSYNNEYANYFELCYPTSVERERYIQSKVSNISPSIGHLCLGDLFINKRIINIWTTNFDELIEAGIKTLAPNHSFNVYSSVNKNLVPSNAFSSVIKLHGDYRYDHIKNTNTELQSLESKMQKTFTESLINKGLIVIGYSGSDESIMSILEQGITSPVFLKYGLIWAIPQGISPSTRLLKLMETTCNINENSGIIEIDGFDEILYKLYSTQIYKSDIIENRWSDYDHKKLPICFQSQPNNNFIKLNAFETENFPQCMVFDTDIDSWKLLREVIGDNNTIAALYNKRIYCFENEIDINRIFNLHIKSSINKERIPNNILYQTESVYIGMLYSLIKKSLISNFGLVEFRKNKYYDPNVSNFEKDLDCNAYWAIEISLSAYKGKIYFNLIPTIYLTNKSGNALERLDNQKKVNQIMSKVYNVLYNDKLKYWNDHFAKKGPLEFTYKNFSLVLNKIPISCGGNNRLSHWPSKITYNFEEPEMQFDINDNKKISINQLKGISRFSPLDCSYFKNKNIHRSPIVLAVISPKEDTIKLLEHLSKLNRNFIPYNQNDGFLTQYSGFDTIYKRAIDIPSTSDTERIYNYAFNSTDNMSNDDYLSLLKRFIDQLSTKHDFDIVIIYIPQKYERFREDKLSDYNLHDAIKLYATEKSVRIQFIEERSLKYYDTCKVMWALSTSLYVKAAGILWQSANVKENTAFVGISYAISKLKRTCIGCSQLFDSTGTGIKLLLRKISDPGFLKKNPYMKCDEARSIMSSLRDQYLKCFQPSQLKRIVIHKTTPFTKDEIKGFTQALEGIEDIELLQIQEYSSWRAIRYDSQDWKSKPANFAIHRGTTIPLDDFSFLLWTHGCVQHDDLFGKRLNYYKGGRGIPAPLIVKRYYGKSSGDVIVNEILMLSKMNWNSGDSLYKQLPVTLDFAKVLSRMSKQEEAIYNKPYDFRYFM
jgi:NAD-dependent SIR2 family protein deacetylase